MGRGNSRSTRTRRSRAKYNKPVRTKMDKRIMASVQHKTDLKEKRGAFMDKLKKMGVSLREFMDRGYHWTPSKYKPHQGPQECARRVRQMKRDGEQPWQPNPQ